MFWKAYERLTRKGSSVLYSVEVRNCSQRPHEQAYSFCVFPVTDDLQAFYAVTHRARILSRVGEEIFRNDLAAML